MWFFTILFSKYYLACYWTSLYTNVATVASSGNPVTVTKVSNGQTSLNATINGCGTQYSASLKITIGTPPVPNLYPKRVGGSCYYDAAVDMLSASEISMQFSQNNNNWNSGYVSGNTFTGGYDFLGVSHQLVYARTSNACGIGVTRSANLSIPAPPPNCNYKSYRTFVTTIKSEETSEEKIFDIQKIKVYPNPAKNNLIVSLPKLLNDTWFVVFDDEGKTIFKSKLNSLKTVFDISFMKNGLYLIQVRTKSQVKFTKILKQ